MLLFIITSILALVKIKTGSLVELKNRIFIFFIVTSSVLIFSFNGLYIYLMIKVKSIEVINLKFNESEDYYKKFTFLLDGNISFLKQQGTYYEFYGHYDKAIEIYERISKKSLTIDYFYKIGSLHFKIGNYGEAEEYFKKALNFKPQSVHFLMGLLQVQLILKKCHFAKETLEVLEQRINQEKFIARRQYYRKRVGNILQQSCL